MNAPAEPPLLSLRKISKAFAGVDALHEVSLDLFPSQVLALLGENGAGKSTLMNIVSGNLQPDSGTIRVGRRESSLAAMQAWLYGSVLPISTRNYPRSVPCLYWRTFFWMITGQTVGGSSIGAEWWSSARELLSRVGGKNIDPEAQVSGLGIADQQIVEIAKALSRNARLLIMDEPTSSLTPHKWQRYFKIVRELRGRRRIDCFYRSSA